MCGEDVPNGKPAPDAFLLAAEQLGVAPGDCVGYEDAALGMQVRGAACAMGGGQWGAVGRSGGLRGGSGGRAGCQRKKAGSARVRGYGGWAWGQRCKDEVVKILWECGCARCVTR